MVYNYWLIGLAYGISFRLQALFFNRHESVNLKSCFA